MVGIPSLLDSEYEIYVPSLAYFYLFYDQGTLAYLIVAIGILFVSTFVLTLFEWVRENEGWALRPGFMVIFGIFLAGAELTALKIILFDLGSISWAGAIIGFVILVANTKFLSELLCTPLFPTEENKEIGETALQMAIEINPFLSRSALDKATEKGIRVRNYVRNMFVNEMDSQ